jgi:hypothetical protein
MRVNTLHKGENNDEDDDDNNNVLSPVVTERGTI